MRRRTQPSDGYVYSIAFRSAFYVYPVARCLYNPESAP